VARDVAERNAFLGGDVMEQLKLVLGEVFGVGLEQGPPQPSVQLVELFGLRLVRHAVQYTGSGGKWFGGALAMIEIARERNISAPAARVWEVVAEAERLPEWYARAASVEVLDGAGLGRRQRLRSEWRGQDSEVDQLITAFEPERLLEWRHEAERLGGQPAPRFALEDVVRIELEAQGPNATRVVMESRQRPADPEKEQAMRGNSEYLGKMLETSLERLEQVVTRGSQGAATST
jgi:uncharacterized protein YndB with AHSA1/START domain